MRGANLSTRTNIRGVRQARFKPLDFQSRDAWVQIPHALPTLGRMLIVTTSVKCLVTFVPCRPSVWVVAQLAEHRTVTAASEGSTPFDPPKSLPIFNCRFPIGSKRSKCFDFQTSPKSDDHRCAGRNRQSAIGNRKCSELWPRGEALGCQPSR